MRELLDATDRALLDHLADDYRAADAAKRARLAKINADALAQLRSDRRRYERILQAVERAIALREATAADERTIDAVDVPEGQGR